MKIVLTRDDVKDILLSWVFDAYETDLDVDDKTHIAFNEWQLPYEDLTFEKKRILEIKLEDVADMVQEQLKAKGEQDAV